MRYLLLILALLLSACGGGGETTTKVNNNANIHLHISSEARAIFEQKVKYVILVGSYDGGGDANERGSVEATKAIFNNPPNVEIFSLAWGTQKLELDDSKIKNKVLRAILNNGVYNKERKGKHPIGDTDLLNYVLQDNLIHKFKETCFGVKGKGNVYELGADCNQFKLWNATSDMQKWYENLFYK